MPAQPELVQALLDFGSGVHWLIILFVALLLFGRRLPEIMKGLGGSIREFKKGMDTDSKPEVPPTQHIDGAVSRPSAPPPPGEPPVPAQTPPPTADDRPKTH